MNKLYDAISTMIAAKLKRDIVDSSSTLSTETCTKAYQGIFEACTDIFEGAQLKLSNEFANYVAQQFYSMVKLNGSDLGLDPNIFNQLAKVENIPTAELRFGVILFKDTDYVYPLLEEIRKRS